MAQPVFKLFLTKFTEAWYQLSQEEQDALLARLTAALEEVGGKGTLYCNANWSSEQWQVFGIEEYPNVEAVQKLAEIHNELKWFRYVESMSVLGTEWDVT